MISMLIAGLTRFITGANARWVGCTPEDRQRVYFANHTSHLDAIVIWSILPPHLRAKTRPVAARDYWAKSKVRLGIATNVFHAVLIERERISAKNNPMDLLLSALDAGGSLIIFPEGTRGTGETVHPFKSGLFHMARKRPDIEFIPIHIDNMNRILPKGEVLPVPLLSCVSFGAPLRIEAEESKSVFLERARQAVSDLHQS